MFDQSNRGKIKNAKILDWRLELNTWLTTFAIHLVAKTSRLMHSPMLAFCSLSLLCKTSRHYRFVRQLNLPYSCEETRTVCRNCRTYGEVKPTCFRPSSQTTHTSCKSVGSQIGGQSNRGAPERSSFVKIPKVVCDSRGASHESGCLL